MKRRKGPGWGVPWGALLSASQLRSELTVRLIVLSPSMGMGLTWTRPPLGPRAWITPQSVGEKSRCLPQLVWRGWWGMPSSSCLSPPTPVAPLSLAVDLGCRDSGCRPPGVPRETSPHGWGGPGSGGPPLQAQVAVDRTVCRWDLRAQSWVVEGEKRDGSLHCPGERGERGQPGSPSLHPPVPLPH